MLCYLDRTSLQSGLLRIWKPFGSRTRACPVKEVPTRVGMLGGWYLNSNTPSWLTLPLLKMMTWERPAVAHGDPLAAMGAPR